jgi:hypothetical protein
LCIYKKKESMDFQDIQLQVIKCKQDVEEAIRLYDEACSKLARYSKLVPGIGDCTNCSHGLAHGYTIEIIETEQFWRCTTSRCICEKYCMNCAVSNRGHCWVCGWILNRPISKGSKDFEPYTSLLEDETSAAVFREVKL